RISRCHARTVPLLCRLLSVASDAGGRTDPYRCAWDAGMVAGQGGGAVAGLLATGADRGAASDLSFHRQRSGRGGTGPPPPWRGDAWPSAAASGAGGNSGAVYAAGTAA